MLRRSVSVLLLTLMVSITNPANVFGKSQEDEARKAQKVKAAILSLGVGPQARVKVKLKDKTKLEGYIKETGDDHFVIFNPKTGVDTTVAFSQVSKAQGKNSGNATKIAIGAGIAAGVVILILAIVFHGFTPS